MAQVANNTKFTLDGVTDFQLGNEFVQWAQPDKWLGHLHVGPQNGLVGTKVSLTFAGTGWFMGMLRFNQGSQMDITIRDNMTATGAGIEYLCLSHAPNDVVLKNLSVNFIRGGNSDDNITTGAGNIGQVRLQNGNNTLKTGKAWVESVSAWDGDDTVNVGAGGAGQILLNHGDNVVMTSTGWVDSISTRDGDDRATIGDGGAGSVNLGHGDNVVKTGKGWVDSIVTRSGEDMVTVGKGAVEFVSLGGGSDTAVLTRLANADNFVTVQGGQGTDLLDLSRLTRGVDLDLGSGYFESKDGKFLVLSFENVIGTAKSDEITGTDGVNEIDGGKGGDDITGGKGADELTGGGGGDRFIYLAASDSTSSAKGRDLITDFSQSQKDKVDLSTIDAKTGGGADDDFIFIGDDPFSKTKGELRFMKDDDETFVYGDINGDGKADFAIEFAGGINFKAADFVL